MAFLLLLAPESVHGGGVMRAQGSSGNVAMSVDASGAVGQQGLMRSQVSSVTSHTASADRGGEVAQGRASDVSIFEHSEARTGATSIEFQTTNVHRANQHQTLALKFVSAHEDGMPSVYVMGDSVASDRVTNMTTAKALEESFKALKEPDEAEMTRRQKAALVGKPNACAKVAVDLGCNFTHGEVSADLLAALLTIPSDTVGRFFEKIGIAKDAKVECQSLCEKSLASIPASSRPPKSWVSAERVADKVYWVIDTSPDTIRKEAGAIASKGETNPDATTDSTSEGGTSHNNDKPPAGTDSGNFTWTMSAVSLEVCELFGLRPFMDATTGSLLDIGSAQDGFYLMTSDACMGYKEYKQPCYCFSPRSYPSWLQNLYQTVQAWNGHVLSHQTWLGAHWAPKIFKRPSNDPTLLTKMGQLYGIVASPVEVCYDFYLDIIKPGVLAYTNRQRRFFYSGYGFRSDLTTQIICWFHEASHMSPLLTDDIPPHGWQGSLDHRMDDAIRDADSYEVYVNRIVGIPVHASNLP